jgi:xyloglucan-specific endo-beta-1,4-glucanase
MKTSFRNLAVAAVLATCAASAAQAATWASSDKWGSYSTNGYSFSNDVWGSGAGPETIWVNSVSDWGVWSDQPNTGGIKSYPHISRYIGKRISQLGGLTSHMQATTPSSGAWESTYDIWDTNHAYEIMLWMNYTGTSSGCGNVKPISYNWNSSGCAIPVYWNVSVGGSTWNIYRGNNGGNMVFSFLRTSKTNYADVNIKDILNWLKNNGWMGDVTMGEVQYGFEITSSSGGMNFGSQNFNVNSW